MKKPAKPQKQKPPPDPRHNEVLRCYLDGFKASRGITATNVQALAKQVQRMIAAIGADASLSAIRGAFGDTFWSSKVTLTDIARNPDKFRGHAPGSIRIVAPAGNGWLSSA